VLGTIKDLAVKIFGEKVVRNSVTTWILKSFSHEQKNGFEMISQRHVNMNSVLFAQNMEFPSEVAYWYVDGLNLTTKVQLTNGYATLQSVDIPTKHPLPAFEQSYPEPRPCANIDDISRLNLNFYECPETADIFVAVLEKLFSAENSRHCPHYCAKTFMKASALDTINAQRGKLALMQRDLQAKTLEKANVEERCKRDMTQMNSKLEHNFTQTKRDCDKQLNSKHMECESSLNIIKRQMEFMKSKVPPQTQQDTAQEEVPPKNEEPPPKSDRHKRHGASSDKEEEEAIKGAKDELHNMDNQSKKQTSDYTMFYLVPLACLMCVGMTILCMQDIQKAAGQSSGRIVRPPSVASSTRTEPWMRQLLTFNTQGETEETVLNWLKDNARETKNKPRRSPRFPAPKGYSWYQ